MPPGAWLVDLGPRLLPEQDLEALRTDAQASSPGGWVIQLADAATEEVYELLTGIDDEQERRRLMDWHMPWHGAADCLERGSSGAGCWGSFQTCAVAERAGAVRAPSRYGARGSRQHQVAGRQKRVG